MNRRNQILIAAGLVLVLIAAGILYVNAVSAQEGVQAYDLPARFSYAAKFVCGYQATPTVGNPPSEPPVKKGNYATVINIHNPYNQKVELLKKVVVPAFERHTKDTTITPNKPPTQRFKDGLRPDFALSVDCAEIVNLLNLNQTPPVGGFIEGYVVIDSYFPATAGSAAAPANVDVQAVYTVAGNTDTGASGIEVNDVKGRRLPAGVWPY